MKILHNVNNSSLDLKKSMLKGTDLAEQLFSQIIGMKITRSKLGYGSFITMDWGKDIIEELKIKDGIEKKYLVNGIFGYICVRGV